MGVLGGDGAGGALICSSGYNELMSDVASCRDSAKY